MFYFLPAVSGYIGCYRADWPDIVASDYDPDRGILHNQAPGITSYCKTHCKDIAPSTFFGLRVST